MINKIHNVDCMDGFRTLGEESIDAIITDPPYGIDYQSARRVDKEKRHKKIANDKAPFVWFLYDAFRVLKWGGCLLCFCRWDTQQSFIDAAKWAGFNVKSSVVWNRLHHGMGDLKASFAPMHDCILFATKGSYEFPGKRPKDVFDIRRVAASDMVHPNEKPIELLESLIEATTKEGNTVLDPFAGSGSTLVACKVLGRDYIGFELDTTYCDISNKRLQDVVPKSA